MAGAPSRLEGDQPQAEEPSRGIDCPVSVLQNLRASVLERFNSTPHGGSEITGVLFGTRNGDEVRITAFCPSMAQGELQQSEVLTETQRAIAAVIAAAGERKELAGLEPVGWFRAHPRCDLNLAERDLEIANALFPHLWQLAMTMRPGNSAASRVRFYFREQEGAWTTDCAVREFTLPHADLQPAREFEADAGGAVNAVPVEERPSHMSALLAPPARRTTSGFPVMAATLIVVAGLAGGLYYWFLRPQPIGLNVRDTESAAQIRIGWDKSAGPVRNARAGYVEIADGGQSDRVDLDAEQLQIGYVNHERHSGEVTVRLVLQSANGTAVEEAVQFVAPPGQAPAVETARTQPPSETAEGEKTPEMDVPVPVDTREPVEERPKFQPPVAQPAKSTPVDHAPAPEISAPAGGQRSVPASLVSPPIVHTEPPPEKPAPPPRPVNTAPAAANSALPGATAPAQTPARAAVTTHTPAAPSSGRVIWIGRLQKNQPVTINGKNASTGTLIGEMPGRSFKYSVSPGDLSGDGIILYTSNLQYANSVVEPPGAQNGWNRTVYTWNPKYANDISVDEAPTAQNGWGRMVLHSKNPKISVIVIDWTAVN